MPIPVLCSCGKQFRVADEHLGRRVRCPGCGEGVRVTDDSATADPEMIRFTCECGKQLQVKAEYAGKMTRCPNCGDKVEVPDTEEPPGRESRSRIQSEPPSTRKTVPSRLRDDDDDEEEERPRRARRDEDDEEEPRGKRGRRAERDEEDVRSRKRGRKKQKQGALLLIVGLVVAGFLLLGGGGFAAYWVIFRGGGMSETAFIPADGQGFVAIRLADVSKVPAFQQAMRAQGGPDPFATMSNELGVEPAEVERITFVIQDMDQKSFWAVITTAKPYDRKKILGKLQNSREIKHEGKTFHVGQSTKGGPSRPAIRPGAMAPGGMSAGPEGVYFASAKVLVSAPDEATMKRALTAASRKNVTGPLADSIRQIAGSRHLFGAFMFPASLQQQIRGGAQQLPPQAKLVAPLLEATGGTMAMDFGEQLVLEATLKFADENKAKAAKKSIDGLSGLAELFLLPLITDAKANAAVKEALNSFNAEQRGAEIQVKLKVGSQAMDAMKPGKLPGQ